MSQHVASRPPVERLLSVYALTGAILALGLVIRLVLEPLTGSLAGYIYFLPAVVVGALFGGIGPALLATALAIMLGVAAVSQDGLSSREISFALIFGFNGILIAYLGARLGGQHREAMLKTQEMKSQEAHLRSILETVPDAMIVVNEAGRVVSFSAAAERLFQWTAAEMVGRDVSVLMPLRLREKHDSRGERYRRTAIARMIGSGRTLTAVRKDGTLFPIELSVGEVQSTPLFYTGFIRDLTEREQSNAKLKALQAELLSVSRVSAMGEMAAMLAHELNQPLAAIVNFHGAMQRVIDQRPTAAAISLKPSIDEAVEQALRAGEIINRIRDFVGHGDVERKPIALDAAVRDAVGFATMGNGSGHAQVRVEIEPDLRAVLADPVQLQQVLLNLVRNALEAMNGEPDAELVIRAKAMRGKAQVCVYDHGPGIAPDVMPHLFRAFFSTKTDGMGIGLSICQTIVEAHGGKIWVEPNSPKGSIFKFTLPLTTDEDGWKRQKKQSPLSMTTQL